MTANPRLFNLNTEGPQLRPSTELIANGDKIDYEEFAADIYEWLSLLRIESPLLDESFRAKVDSNISRYQVPAHGRTSYSVTKLSWQGFISPDWVQTLLKDLLLQLPLNDWLSVSATSVSKDVLGTGAEVTFTRPPKSPGEFLMWEVKGHE